jgi:hypothetical protein
LAPVSKTDPKHGRWILPLVIAGLIGFTYLFVEALPPAAVEANDTGDTVADGGDGDTTDTTAAEGTDGTVTTSTLAPEIAQFIAAVDDYTVRTADLATEAQTINGDWDDRTIDFAGARDAMAQLETETNALTTEINATVVPADATEAWNVVIASAATLDTAAADMLDGLVNSSTSEKRLTALETYTTTAADMAVGYDLAKGAVGG